MTLFHPLKMALTGCVVFFCLFPQARAQSKLSIDNVYTAYLRNSGVITEQGTTKGYFLFYQSDKIDRHTDEYTLQILDENLNKVSNIKFQDSKKVYLLESAYNGGSLSFLFKNEDTKTLDMKIYDLSGKLLYTYSRPFDRRTDALMRQYENFKLHSDDGTNKNIFDLGEQGYVSVLPLREGSHRTYEVDFFSSKTKQQWTYEPINEDDHYAEAEYLGCTDSLIVLEVMQKSRALTGKFTSHFIGVNFVTRKKAFEIDNSEADQQFVPISLDAGTTPGQMLVMGSYFDNNQDPMKDFSKGLAVYGISTSGKILSKTYNSWAGDFARYLPTNNKGKIDKVGYLYIHKLLRTPDGKLFAVGEGYKRKADALGIGLTALSVMGGGGHDYGTTKIVITDMVMMQFNEKNKIVNATIYDKTENTAFMGESTDFNSQHLIAAYLKMVGAFDYAFTTESRDDSTFTVWYGDYVRNAEFHGQTFNAIRYNGAKFNTDHMNLVSSATRMRILPAKPGSIMIMEYFKKQKKLDLRLQKLG